MAAKVISEIGKRLSQHTRPNKDFLVKSLRQAASALSELDQNPSLEPAIKALSDYLLKHGLLQHKDRDVRLLLAICFTEIIRVLAPEPPFSDNDFREIFKLIISMFVELADTTSPYFSRRVKILETVAELKCCLLMLDIDCDDLVLEMFNTFFSVVRENHQQSLVDAILSIMTLILKEKVSQPLMDVILRNLLKEGKGAPPASFRLAVSVIKACSEKLEPFVCGFLTSCILDRDAVQSELKEFYHEIIFKIYQCAPHMLLAVIPNLTEELLTDQVDVRIKAVNLIGKLFALPEHHVAQEYRRLFAEFLKRFSDKSAEVRDSALQCAKDCYMANPSGTESVEVLSALYGRLLDFDDKVRTRAVVVACDLARSNLKFIPPTLISEVTQRLRDKKISVRKKALQKLLEVYRDYCTKCSEGYMSISDHFEQIPCRILMLCYDKDCKEFRPQNMEFVLAEDLFPVPLSVEERTRHWIFMFSLFSSLHVKALNSILSQKRRFQTEMQLYLALRKKEKENVSEEVQKRIKASFIKMSSFFPDPSKAEECLHKLNEMKDNCIFNTLLQLLDEVTIINAQTMRDKFLKMIGDRYPHFEFLRSLSTKCLFNIFSSEHIGCILDHLSGIGYVNEHLQAASVDLLLAIISIFPSLLRGSERQFQMLLLEEDTRFSEKLIQVLAKAGPHISIKLSDIYPSLERICLEGTRAQSKFAVSAIAALISTSEQFVFSELCKALMDSLHSGCNVPTVLQSLGCIAQHSVSTFETRDREITAYINEKIFQVEQSDDLTSFCETFEPSNSCKLKIYGLKTLVKSFLPHRGTHVKRQISELLDVLSKMLRKDDIMDDRFSRESDKAHIRLAAAKSILRLSKRWDLHISPEIFHYTVLMAKDPSSSVRKLFLDKTYKLLKEHVIPSRYACAFALGTSDYFKDLQDDPCNYMAEFIKEYSREARIRQTSAMQGGSIIDYPVYIVVFLIHILAHDKDFPPEGCQDEEMYARFCSAIRRAEDAVDSQRTPKLHILADIGISTVYALNHSGISTSHAHGLILLPSSLYRISIAKKSEEASSKYLTRSAFDENFVKRIIHTFKSHISVPASALDKHGRKFQEDSSKSDVIKYSILNLASCMQIVLSTNRTNEDKGSYARGKETEKSARQEISTRGRQKRAISSTIPRSVGSHNECFRVDGDKNGASGHSEPLLGKEQISSCDSVTTKSLLMESQVSTQNVDVISDAPSKENDLGRKFSSITAEPSKLSRAKLKDHCCLKEMGNKSEALVGQRIKLLSPVDKCFHSGTVDGFNSENNIHKITYDSGEVELLCLASESWETISSGSLPEKEVILAEESNTFHLRHW
ncbi:hypothetical protein L1049_026670 [Liquidambar formosana]|uniref:Sister chromatid cohesion protein PDS5 homolog A n=1 Tax=Liquidambar formosana TaxID=63359 RepID=A0AAP0R918_LIQFO